MIDYVHLSLKIHIPDEEFNWSMWRDGEDAQTGRHNYWHICRRTTLHYYPDTAELFIAGKIITLLYDTQVQNVDDLYGADTDAFISDINRYINSLFCNPHLDIRDFYVLRFDYCFNVKTPYVAEYVTFMNSAFSAVNKGIRINHTEEYDLDGSIYVKTRSDYEHNIRRNYVLNFYNKYDWMQKCMAKGSRFSEYDREHAPNTLRLEAQCSYQFLKGFCKKHGVHRTFGEIFSYQLAYDAIATVYHHSLRADITQDYFSYTEAKKLVPAGKPAKVLEKSSKHHDITAPQFKYAVKLIQKAGIYPYSFIPKALGIKLLENPLRLILQKVAGYDIWLQQSA